METGSDGGDQSRLRQLNERAVLRAVRGAGGLRVSELVDQTGLGRTAIEDLVLSLVERRWLTEERSAAGARGRPARTYRFRAEAGYVAGVDIGAYGVRAVLSDLAGEVIATARQELAPSDPRADRLDAADRAISACIDAAPAGTGVWAVGVGTTGTVDSTGRVTRSGAIPDWPGADLAAHFRDSRHALVVVDNDSQLAAVAEHRRGAAQGVADVVLLQAGRRTGLATVVDGRLRRGFHGAAGDLSSLPMVKWEAAIKYLHRCAAVPDSVPLKDRAERVFEAARAGNRAAATAVRRYVEAMAVAAATAIGIVDPQVLVVGGAFSRSADLILEPLRVELEELAGEVPELRASSLGAESVALGGISLALDALDVRLLSGSRGTLPELAAESL